MTPTHAAARGFLIACLMAAVGCSTPPSSPDSPSSTLTREGGQGPCLEGQLHQPCPTDPTCPECDVCGPNICSPGRALGEACAEGFHCASLTCEGGACVAALGPPEPAACEPISAAEVAPPEFVQCEVDADCAVRSFPNCDCALTVALNQAHQLCMSWSPPPCRPNPDPPECPEYAGAVCQDNVCTLKEAR